MVNFLPHTGKNIVGRTLADMQVDKSFNVSPIRLNEMYCTCSNTGNHRLYRTQ